MFAQSTSVYDCTATICKIFVGFSISIYIYVCHSIAPYAFLLLQHDNGCKGRDMAVCFSYPEVSLRHASIKADSLTSASRLYQSEAGSDLDVHCGDRVFKVHQCIVGSQGGFFAMKMDGFLVLIIPTYDMSTNLLKDSGRANRHSRPFE